MKWYIACSVVSLLTGGSAPKASQQSRMMFFGCGPMQGMRALAMKSIGYDARVFSVTALRTDDEVRDQDLGYKTGLPTRTYPER
jgi:hypothetical protein